ncbi:MAG: mechanosensitive ion channel [Desulfosarcina sp.]|nr:mechanosensitive ion channel [Desulfosarcina sp.]MBC2767283.1 mechanosensitive ion channel [Desulfosarcina sp.]
MDTITHYIDRFISLIGAEASLSNSLAKALVALLAAFLLWLIVKRILTTLENKAVHFKFIQVRKELFAILRKMAGLLLIWLVGVLWIRLFQLTAIEKIFHAVFIVVAATPVKSFLLIVLEYLERNLVERTETALDNIVIDLLNKFSGAIVYATAAVIALDVLGVNVMPFIAGAGVMGIAVGFAAKDTLSNLIAGILLIIDRPFEIGDRIEVWSAPAGSASWGDVIDIGLRATRIKTTDNIVVIIPNNEIMTRDIVNYTIISSSIRVRVGESSVDLQLRVWIKDARRRMDTISYITDTVKTLFDENGIEIPFPRRDITIIDRHAGQPLRQKKDEATP